MISIFISPGFKNKFSNYEREIRTIAQLAGVELIQDLSERPSRQFIFIAQDFELESNLSKVKINDLIFRGPNYTEEMFERLNNFKLFKINSKEDWETAKFILRSEVERYGEQVLEQIIAILAQNNNKTIINNNLSELSKIFEQYLGAGRDYKFLAMAYTDGASELTARLRGLSMDEILHFFVEVCLYEIETTLENESLDDKSIIQVLNRGELAFLIMGKNKEVVWFNNAFKELQINPSDIENDNLIFETDLGKWQINILSQQQDLIFYTFQAIEEESDRESGEELGIITSSIAHELNNPLAGISAAVDVLLLEEWSFDQVEALENIKKSVMRCKGLVETFLGFSRKELISEENLRIEVTINQAYELLKFRLIENNYKLIIEHQVQGNLKLTCNSSVLTMVFYLIFNEILTFYSHQALVSLSNNKNLKLVITEYRDSIYIQPNIEINLSQLDKNNLLKHLLQLISLNLKTGKEVRLIKL